ncbi:MAG: hypothetical protein ACMG57_05445 [Candidatus Dojkabacteria bacterium]
MTYSGGSRDNKRDTRLSQTVSLQRERERKKSGKKEPIVSRAIALAVIIVGLIVFGVIGASIYEAIYPHVRHTTIQQFLGKDCATQDELKATVKAKAALLFKVDWNEVKGGKKSQGESMAVLVLAQNQNISEALILILGDKCVREAPL